MTTDHDTPTTGAEQLPALPGGGNRIAVGLASKLGAWGTAIAGIGAAAEGAIDAAGGHAQVLGVPPEKLLAVATAFGLMTMFGRYAQAVAAALIGVFRRGS